MNKRKVPKIRFKGFYDDWEQRKFEEIAVRSSVICSDDTLPRVEYEDIVSGTGRLNKDIYAKQSSKSGIVFHQGDVLYGKLRPYLQNWLLPTFDGLAVGDFWVLQPQNADSSFLYRLIQSRQFDEVANQSTGTKMPRADWKLVSKTVFSIPSNISEQAAIGTYFTALDSLITLHQKKCFEWKKRDFVSVSISWEQRKLGDNIVEYTEKTTENNQYPVLTSSRKGIFFQTDYYDGNQIASADNTGYNIVPYGYFTYRHMSDDEIFHFNINDIAENGIVSTLYPVFTTDENLDSRYLQYQLNYGREFARYAILQKQGGSRTYMYLNKLRNLYLTVPTAIKEQKKISEYFTKLDHLITLHQRKLELLKRLRNSLVDRCFIGEKYTMSKLILYHGSPNRVIAPKFGFGEDRHDYGRGFYLTENLELAKEWAVCRPDETNGWVHKYELEMEGLNILDFQKYDVLSWLAELMKHRDAADSRRYKMLAQKFIEKYGIDTCGYDVITGWRANASYFYIAKEFVRDNIDIEILEELLSLGGLGIQFCIKSERAFAQLSEVEQDIMSVDYSEFNDLYNERDINARNKMRALVDSDANKVTHVFSTLFER